MTAAHVLQIIPNLDAGGAERSAVEISEAVCSRGGRSFVVTEGGRLEGEVTQSGGTIIKLGVSTKNPLKIILNAIAIKKLIKLHGISVVHARSRAPAWSGLIAARLSGVPFVTTYHGAYNQHSSLKGYYNGVMARGDWVIANSRFTARLIQERHDVPDEKLKVIYRGVDMEGLDPVKVSSARLDQLRKEWDIDEDKRVVLLPARLTEWKGQRDLIDAADHLKARCIDDLVYVLAGDAQGRDGYRRELEEKIGDYSLQRDFRITGHVGDMAAAYSLADLVVVASREAEAFGRVAAEAQAMGRPVIATDIGAPPEFLNLGNDGGVATAWLVPPADGAALANKIEDVLSIPQGQREEMALLSRHYIGQNFTAELMKTQTIELYDQLLGGRVATLASK